MSLDSSKWLKLVTSNIVVHSTANSTRESLTTHHKQNELRVGSGVNGTSTSTATDGIKVTSSACQCCMHYECQTSIAS